MITTKTYRVWACPRCGMQFTTPMGMTGAVCRCADSMFYGGMTDMIEVHPRSGIYLEFQDEAL